MGQWCTGSGAAQGTHGVLSRPTQDRGLKAEASLHHPAPACTNTFDLRPSNYPKELTQQESSDQYSSCQGEAAPTLPRGWEGDVSCHWASGMQTVVSPFEEY